MTIGLLGAVAISTTIVIGAGLAGSSRGAGKPASVGGATSVRRRLLVQTDTEPGTIGYADPHTVYDRVSGTITWLPAAGQLIKPGKALYKVDNNPIVLFDGAVPAYRDLTAGISDGPDISELNRNLVKLGFDPGHEITVNNAWQTGTTDAIDRWQTALGETQTGTIALGQVVFLPGEQRVTNLETQIGSPGSSGQGGSASGSNGSGSSATGSGSASARVNVPRPLFVSLTTTTSSASTKPAAGPPTHSATPPASTGSCNGSPRSSSGETRGRTASTPGCKHQNPSSRNPTLAALLALLTAETKELKNSRPSSADGHAGTGVSAGAGGDGATGGSSSSGPSGAPSAQPALQTTSTQLVVTVDLDATKQAEAVRGEPVSVQLPDGSYVNGRITQVSPVAQSTSTGSSSSGSSSSGGSSVSSSTPSASIPVTIGLSRHKHLRGLDQAAVSVNFQQQKASNVLSVPVTALLARAGGGYAVQDAAAPHRLIRVTPGLFAAGYVQISGPGIYVGLRVTDSQG